MLTPVAGYQGMLGVVVFSCRGQCWDYSQGFVNEDMIRSFMPPPGDDVLILMCGPPPMIQYAINPSLDKLNYPQDRRFAY
ncbi:unnamed protein product [Ranitomeya imitator]|uniref:cytochrome-b5 reductase n=1 Tax=Ranitomeya imitator TaxID=111125 RepID=A0ABN9LX69_9NEOB|nr:unnamed protein product [Ranitomeya imitator]